MPPIIGPNPANREEWLAARGRLITSTDVARIMRGEGWTVYHEKLGTIAPFAGNRITRRGNRFQRPTLEEYAEEANAIVFDGLPLVIDPECPALAATPDAVVVPGDIDEPIRIEPGAADSRVVTLADDESAGLLISRKGCRGVEAKTSLSPKVAAELADGDADSDVVPEGWIWQDQSQMACTGWEWVDMAILLFGKLLVRRVKRNAALVDVCRATATEYADRVARHLEPPFEATSEANQQAIRSIYAPTAGTTIDLTDEAADVWAKRAAAAAAESSAKRDKDALDAAMRQHFGNAEIGRLPDGGTIRLGTVHVDEKIVKAYEYSRFWYSRPKTPKGK